MQVHQIRHLVQSLEPRRAEIEARMTEMGKLGKSHKDMASALAVPVEAIKHYSAAKTLAAHKTRERLRYQRMKEVNAAEVEARRAERNRAREAAIAQEATERERRKTQQALQTKIARRLRDSRKAAEARGLIFNLTGEHIEAAVADGVCQRTGIAFEPRGDFAASMDRIDNTRGYAPDNVQIVCWAYNRAKNNSTDAAVLRMSLALVDKVMQDTGKDFCQLLAESQPFEWD